MNRAGRSRPPWWAWPSLLVIDAPVVAVAWAYALARAAGAPFTAVEAAAVGLGTAAVYLFDRARDAGRLTGDRRPTLRHAFAATRTPSVAVAATVAALATLSLTPWLAPAAIAWGAGVAIVAAPLLLASRRGRGGAGWRPAAVGTIFAAGAATPAAAGPDGGPALAAAVLGLAGVAGWNVTMIAGWEAHLDDGATPSPAASEHAGLPFGRLAFGVALAIGLLVGRPWLSGLGTSLATAAALLALLEAASARARRTGPGVERSELWHLAADAALVVALLALPLG